MLLLFRGSSSFSCDEFVMMTFFLMVLIGVLSCSEAYFIRSTQKRQRVAVSNYPNYSKNRIILSSSSSSSSQRLFPRHTLALSSTSSADGFETDTTSLCKSGRFDEAIASLEILMLPDDDLKACYVQILHHLADRQTQIREERIVEPKSAMFSHGENDNEYMVHLDQAETILQSLLELGKTSDNELLLPSAEEFNNVIKMWGSSTFVDNASVKCQSYLDSLWSLYNERKNARFVPMPESYLYSVSACSARDRGLDAAKRAESLMKDMESRRRHHPQLTPNRSIANGVMNAWSKSGQKSKIGKKCENVLVEMIRIAKSEENGKRQDIAPDTKSFNIVLNALAQGRGKDSEVRAESLLEKMESLSSSGEKKQSGNSLVLNCPPDEITFNTVLNCWAMSRSKGAAARATAILDHMKRRHEAGLTTVHPDWSTYTTVLKAWARSRDPNAISCAEDVFSEYLQACESGKKGFAHNAFAYNSMINCYAKSKHPDAGKRALELFQKMKDNMGKPGREMCFVDIYTYTSLIDAISKQQSYEASEQAISLLEEVEESFRETGDMRFQPNIRLYTSVVNAIGRSHTFPDRAKAIVDRVESFHLQDSTHNEVKLDVVFYNALINAYGWSDIEGRSWKSFEILKRMISLSESGRLVNAKPDTVSFNSVLNACAHEQTKDKGKSEDIMKIVVEVFELLNNSPEYGRPDQRTYVQVLDSIANHMTRDDKKRTPMAEATFLQCASNGLVGPVVIPKLYATVPRSRFQALMGPASYGEENQLKFDVSYLPSKWTINALSRSSRNGRRSRSRRVQSNFQVTKNLITSSTQKNRKQNQ